MRFAWMPIRILISVENCARTPPAQAPVDPCPMAPAIEHDHLAARPCQVERQAASHHPGADDHDVRAPGHVSFAGRAWPSP